MDTKDLTKAQGHWILARMGKRVLRPGGRELTVKLVEALQISNTDNITEFAPGLGYTASLALKYHPSSYTGVDMDENIITLLKQKLKGDNIHFVHGNASQTGLPDESKDKVYGEAMLTMHADHRKAEIIQEAHRILKKGGLYAIHELGIFPDELSEELKAEIQKDLAQSIKVNARPLTVTEWKNLVEKEGFRVKRIETTSMHLLEMKRIMDDEGFFRMLKISFNILMHPQARKRIYQMREIFRKHQSHINALILVAEKI